AVPATRRPETETGDAVLDLRPTVSSVAVIWIERVALRALERAGGALPAPELRRIHHLLAEARVADRQVVRVRIGAPLGAVGVEELAVGSEEALRDLVPEVDVLGKADLELLAGGNRV